MTAVILPGTSASAAAPFVVINGGGGTTGTGLKLEINRSYENRYEQIWFEGAGQYYYGDDSGDVGPYLSIGGTLFGQTGAAWQNRWASVEVVETSGSASTDAATTTGSGAATLRYTAVHGGLDYVVERRVSYIYPNAFFTDDYTFVIPAGNTSPVTFYAGGDTTPGGSDSGYGIMHTAPVRSVISLNPSSGVQIGYREVSGSRPFTGATAVSYSSPYIAMQTGGDIGFLVETGNHDAGLMMQWTLGSDPGSHTGRFQTFVGEQAATLNASFSAPGTPVGAPVNLALSIDNSLLAPQAGVGFRVALPAGLVVADGAQTNACLGTVTAVPGTAEVLLDGGWVAAAANCVLEIPVASASSGSFTLASAAVLELTNLSNGVGTTTLVVGTAPAGPAAPLPALAVGAPIDVLLGFGGDPAPAYLVTAGALPSGLALDRNSGRITGAPTAAGPVDVTITATNAIGALTHRYLATVTTGPTWSEQTLPATERGVPLAVGFTATGTPVPTYAVTSGALPAGLAIDGDTLSGTPTATGAYDFTVTATNTGGTAQMRFTGSTVGAPIWPVQTLPRPIVGAAYDAQLRASGEPAPTYTVTAGALPGGLALDAVTGSISGTPRAPGAFDFSVSATNAAGIASQRFEGTVGTTPSSLTVTLALALGEIPNAEGSHFTLAGTGLLPGTPYTVVMRSTPRILVSGVVPVNGSIARMLQLPASIEPGIHSLTVSTTAADGTPVTSMAWFRIAADGTVMGVSQLGEFELAATGTELSALYAGVSLLVIGAGLMLGRRRWARRAA